VRLLILCSVSALLCGCGPNEADTNYAASAYPVATAYRTPSPTPSATATPFAPQSPAHYYDARDGVLYSYIAAISEDDRKAGKAAGDVFTFAYLGKRDGKHVLVRVTADGRPIEEAYCGSPCRVISYPNGRQIAYNEGSIIGGAFADAIAGRMIIASYSDQAPIAPLPQPAAPAPTPTASFTDEEARLLFAWLDANEKCEAAGDASVAQQACSDRDEVYGPALTAAGICYGRRGEPAAVGKLHRCEPNSLALPRQ
jgi:hypothetical protein